jgi:hypothetical protein
VSGVDLVQWLTAALDDDERIARAAADELGGTPLGAEWRYDDRSVETSRERDLVAVGSQDFMEPRVGAHIAEHDPARVLREIAAKRKRIALHQPEPGQHPDFCGYDKHELPCLPLRLEAAPYEDRPGYQEAWRPQS